MIPADDPQSRAVIDIATRLFAAFGYDGTSLQGIAEAAGEDLGWVQRRFGDKHDLYLVVIDHASRAERAVVEDALSALPAADPQGVAAAMYGLSERYLEFCLTSPQIPALWMHRWLGDAADIPDLERIYSVPLINFTRDALRSAARAGLIDDQVDLGLMIRTLIWSVYGFLHGETIAEADRSVSADPQARQRFLAHHRQLVDRMLRLPGA
ncbi:MULTISPECIES: TetR/AcrR family transcriptional regulator [unclassified Streptosporangium]|uniref:TetR/AcrR family transcriptional regulator n=1 Tax=unclassified Streptosporangium TaxID=2632669 RepID=UPI002E2E6301|nr:MULTISPECIES: TetR/AcrR family transcriptional regulator [unclassified Streptosporangium]